VASNSYLRQTKWAVCEISVWAHYEIVIEILIDRSLDVLSYVFVVIIASSCISLTVLRLSVKQDNAPVKAQSYSHILLTSKHRQQHRYVLADGNVATIMLKVCTVIWHSLLSRKNPATDASSKSAIAHVGANCGTTVVGTLSRTVQSFSSTPRRIRNTLGRRNQRRGHGAGLSGLAMSSFAISALPKERLIKYRLIAYLC